MIYDKERIEDRLFEIKEELKLDHNLIYDINEYYPFPDYGNAKYWCYRFNKICRLPYRYELSPIVVGSKTSVHKNTFGGPVHIFTDRMLAVPWKYGDNELRMYYFTNRVGYGSDASKIEKKIHAELIFENTKLPYNDKNHFYAGKYSDLPIVKAPKLDSTEIPLLIDALHTFEGIESQTQTYHEMVEPFYKKLEKIDNDLVQKRQ